MLEPTIAAPKADGGKNQPKEKQAQPVPGPKQGDAAPRPETTVKPAKAEAESPATPADPEQKPKEKPDPGRLAPVERAIDWNPWSAASAGLMAALAGASITVLTLVLSMGSGVADAKALSVLVGGLIVSSISSFICTYFMAYNAGLLPLQEIKASTRQELVQLNAPMRNSITLASVSMYVSGYSFLFSLAMLPIAFKAGAFPQPLSVLCYMLVGFGILGIGWDFTRNLRDDERGQNPDVPRGKLLADFTNASQLIVMALGVFGVILQLYCMPKSFGQTFWICAVLIFESFVLLAVDPEKLPWNWGIKVHQILYTLAAVLPGTSFLGVLLSFAPHFGWDWFLF